MLSTSKGPAERNLQTHHKIIGSPNQSDGIRPGGHKNNRTQVKFKKILIRKREVCRL
jgi:hypothetical protein